MADNSPTSGGDGDVIRTEDTAAVTNTGTPGAKLADGKIVVGRKDVDGGAASLDTPLDTHDWRTMESVTEMLLAVVVLMDRIWANERIAGVKTINGACNSITTTSVSGTLTSTQLVAADGQRQQLRIVNDSTSTGILYILIGGGKASSAAGGYSVPLPPGAVWEALPGEQVFAVQGAWATAAGFANITQIS